jgi:hypothetical protein
MSDGSLMANVSFERITQLMPLDDYVEDRAPVVFADEGEDDEDFE